MIMGVDKPTPDCDPIGQPLLCPDGPGSGPSDCNHMNSLVQNDGAGFNANIQPEKVHFLEPGYMKHLADTNNQYRGNIRTTFYAQKNEPWLEESLPLCPEDESRITMDMGKTHVVGYPNVGASCRRPKKAAKVDETPASGLMEL